MDSNWKRVKLEDVVEKINTGLDAIKRAPIVSYPTQIKCLRIQDISQNKSISEWGCTKVKESDYENYRLRKGEIIMARTCSTGINFLVKDDLKAVFNNGLARIRVKKSKVSEKFLFYIFRSSSFINYINGISCGTSVQLNMKVGDLSNYEFLLPSLVEQNKIASILGTFDEKIELNNKTNKILEEIAKALFKSWFIDFDPVKAKSEGRSTGLPDEISDLFPDSFEDSELGQVPIGWECGKLGNYLSIKRGGSPRPITNFIVENGIPWVKISDATSSKNSFIFTTKEFIKSEGLSKTVFLKKGSLILSNSATPGLPKFLELDACIHDGWLYFPEKEKFSDLYLYQLFLSIRSKLCLLGNGSVFTNLKTDILKNYNVIIPSKECLDLFDMQVDSLHQRCKYLTISSNYLCEIRNILQTKLISGELRIPDAEKMIEEFEI